MESIKRCTWCEKDDLYRNYHDYEWGRPIYNDDKIFEYLIEDTTKTKDNFLNDDGNLLTQQVITRFGAKRHRR